MKKGWTTTKLIAVGGLGVFWLIISLPGHMIINITGFQGTAGGINVVISAFLMVLAALTIKTHGSVILLAFIYQALSVPLHVAFFPKFISAILASAMFELIFQISKEKKISVFLAGGVSQVAWGYFNIMIAKIFGIPGVDFLIKIMFSPLIVIFVFGISGFSGLGGYFIYQKIKNASVVKRIQQ